MVNWQLLASAGQRLVVLLGDPGAGKSTLARYVVLTLAGRMTTRLILPTRVKDVELATRPFKHFQHDASRYEEAVP